MALNDYAPEDIHIDQDVSNLSGEHWDELFFNCTFKKLNNLVLKNCELNRSKFITDKVEDALGFTLTLGCMSFSNVELSELLFDLMLCLLMKSSGNTEKRRKLIDVVGRSRVAELLKTLERLEA
jgi:CO dehydrogenase/acetyl-CoA synthase delta subunit